MNAMRNTAPVNWEDRRAEIRLKATGNVTLRLNEEYQVPFEAKLMDISASGFRARHANTEMRSGRECEFSLPGTKGRAKAVWNKTTPQYIETGFLILTHEAI